jgi:hypothetical protein
MMARAFGDAVLVQTIANLKPSSTKEIAPAFSFAVPRISLVGVSGGPSQVRKGLPKSVTVGGGTLRRVHSRSKAAMVLGWARKIFWRWAPYKVDCETKTYLVLQSPSARRHMCTAHTGSTTGDYLADKLHAEVLA